MIRSERIVHEGPGGLFEGLVCWDDALAGPRPGVLVVHTFLGQGAFENGKAEALAALGYVAFAVDLYGQGKRGTTTETAAALMLALEGDRPLLAARMERALAVLRARPEVDPDCIGAIGFCFGGKSVIDLARTGADLRGVVSFHGVYDPPPMVPDTPIRAALLILHGWEDPLAPPESVVALGHELTARGADWQIQAFSHTGHSFTNPNVARHAEGLFFQPRTNARAWAAMQGFLAEIFA